MPTDFNGTWKPVANDGTDELFKKFGKFLLSIRPERIIKAYFS
jgi:hypothetical protein